MNGSVPLLPPVCLRFLNGSNLNFTVSMELKCCGCETWSLTLREERKLKVFENMVLRRYLDRGGSR